jgi:two-component system KDP operon response regulator KdpE
LGAYGYEVATAANGDEALSHAAQDPPALMVLDMALGTQPDGLGVCRRVREWSRMPIIILSVRGDHRTKVLALDAGADDYVTKPFVMEELRARIQAVLRRTEVNMDAHAQPEIQVGALRIDFANRRVRLEDEEIHLTPTEYDVLRLLALHPGRIITHRMILSQVWGPEYAEMTHYVRIYVNQLRHKLRENPAINLRYILNEPGIGYRFVDVD